MKLVRIRKRFILVVLCTILLTLFFAPIYSDHLVIGLWDSLWNNETARIDINNRGNISNEVEVTPFQVSEKTEITYPSWCKKEDGSCAVVNANIDDKWQDFAVEVKVVNSGKITIYFRGPDVRTAENIRYPVLVDYRFSGVDKKELLKGRKTFWHDNPLQYQFNAKDGQKIEVKFQVRKHHFRFSDLQNVYHMNWLLFISVLILSFLLSYKLIQYISKFKLLEHNSRIDIVFIAVFFVLLFVPMSHISSAEKSMQENRILATYPKLFNKVLNLEYGKQFEQWFNDRFFGRNIMIDLYSFLKMNINHIYRNGGAFWIKDNNWMYREWDIKQKEFEKNKADEIIKQTNLFSTFCRENNIKMYMLIVPSKESIYTRFLPKEYKKVVEHNQFNHYINSLISSFDVSTVFPYKELHQASYKDFIFFKQSHHWTDWGAYNGYLALMDVIKKDYPKLHISTLDEYNISTSKLLREDYERNYDIGQTTGLLRIDKDYAKENILKDDYIYYNHKNEIKPIITDNDSRKEKYFKNPQHPDAPRVFLTGTSMNEDLLQFLPYSFSETKYYRLNSGKMTEVEMYKLLKRFKKDILDYKPDILILCVTTWNLPHLVNLTKD